MTCNGMRLHHGPTRFVTQLSLPKNDLVEAYPDGASLATECQSVPSVIHPPRLLSGLTNFMQYPSFERRLLVPWAINPILLSGLDRTLRPDFPSSMG